MALYSRRLEQVCLPDTTAPRLQGITELRLVYFYLPSLTLLSQSFEGRLLFSYKQETM